MKGRKDQIGRPSSFACKITNGAIAGTIGVSFMYPVDLAKTRLQNQLSTGIKTTTRVHYKNLFDCLYKVVQTEGIAGCYKGIGVNVLLVNPEKAIKFAVNDQARQMMGGKGKILPLHYEVLAGAIAGLCQVIVTTPMEMLKIQMQVSGKTQAITSTMPVKPMISAKFHTDARPNIYKTSTTKTHSALALTKDLLQTKGITGMYRGLAATLLRDIPFSCIYFTLFSYANILGVGPNGEKPRTVHTFFSAIGAGIVSSVTVTPCDVIKTRLQVIPNNNEQPRYSGIKDCAKKIYHHEGLPSFFKGAVPRMMAIAPLFGISQAVYFFEIAETLFGVNK